MSTGILGNAALAAEVDTVVYTVPQGKAVVLNISLCNTGAEGALVCLALAQSDTPIAGDYIEYDAALAAHSSMERTGIALQAGFRVVARADAPGVNIIVYGMED